MFLLLASTVFNAMEDNQVDTDFTNKYPDKHLESREFFSASCARTIIERKKIVLTNSLYMLFCITKYEKKIKTKKKLLNSTVRKRRRMRE